MGRKKDRWIQEAIKHHGRVRRYLRMKYGDKAFTKDGDIKKAYIKKAIRELEERPPSKRPPGLINALYLALRLKEMHRK